MSGIKYSEIALEREKKARQDAMQEIEQLEARLKASDRRIEEMLENTAPEVLASFPEVHAGLKAWQEGELPVATEEMNSSELQEVAARMAERCGVADDVQQGLARIREHGRDEKAGELAAQVEMLRNRVHAMRELMDKWEPGRAIGLEQELEGLEAGIRADRFITVAEGCGTLDESLSGLEERFSGLEARDRQRRVVLDAVQEVCREMGWDEFRAPRLEEPEDPASALLFTVETWSDGRMEFRLSLEGIRVDAPFTTGGRLCYSQFDLFSDRLKRFGVKTKFKRLGGPDDLPEDRTSDAIDMDQADEQQYMEQ